MNQSKVESPGMGHNSGDLRAVGAGLACVTAADNRIVVIHSVPAKLP